MRSAPDSPQAYRSRPSPASRAASIFLALGIVGLIVTMLVGLGAIGPRAPEIRRKPVSFQLLPEPRPAARHVGKVDKTPARRGASPPPAARSPVPSPAPPLQMLIVSREVFAASDIAKIPSHQGEQAAGAGEAAQGSGAGDSSSDGPGAGPGGERLYNAEWYREPTDAELAYYLPTGNRQPGWGMIACRTIEQYRVDDCRELADSPPGSGLARAVRQAAWQFRIRPPRIGGRSVVGAWVRIRIDYTQKESRVAR